MGSVIMLLLSPWFVVKAEEIDSNTIVDMANQGKSDLLMVDGFLNICTENIITEPNANQSSESGSNTNQSVDFDKDNDNLNVSNKETEMPSDNI